MVNGPIWTIIDYEWTYGKCIPAKEQVWRALYCYRLEDRKREKFDLKPRYTYKSRRRLNVVTFPINLPPRKNTLLIRLGIAVILAILTKLLLSVLPDSVGSGYIQPATRTHKTRQLYVLFFLPDSQVPFYLIFNDSVNHQFERFTEGRIE